MGGRVLNLGGGLHSRYGSVGMEQGESCHSIFDALRLIPFTADERRLSLLLEAP